MFDETARNRDIINTAHYYGENLIAANEKLKSQLWEKERICADLNTQVNLHVTYNQQKSLNAMHTNAYQKEEEKLKKENTKLTKEVAQLEKIRNDQIEHLKKIREKFELEKKQFAQKKIDLDMQKVEVKFFSQERVILEKQVQEQLFKRDKSKLNAEHAKKKLGNVEMQFKQACLSQTKGQQKKDKRKKEKLSKEKKEKLRQAIVEKSEEVGLSLAEIKKLEKFLKCQAEQIRNLEEEKKKCIVENEEKKKYFAENEKKRQEYINILDNDAIEKEESVNPIQSEEKKQILKKKNPMPLDKVMKDYFWLTCLAVKLSAGQNIDSILTIDPEILWKKALQLNVPWMNYYEWLEKEITRMGIEILYPLDK